MRSSGVSPGRALALGAAFSFAACVQAPSRFREGALAIAQWLEGVAVATPAGVKWPIVPDAPQPEFATALYAGSSGPVLFFLELAHVDGSPRWLELARAGADELIATLPQRGEPADCGLYTGLAGLGFVFDATHRATGEPRYRDAALRCVDALHERAQLAGSGIEWSDTTDVIAGTAGIGAWLLARHEDEGDRRALELAQRAGRRLLDLSQREAVGRSWRMDPRFPRVMPNFSHGTAGVAWFLARLREPPFVDAARDGADHLLSIADRSGDGCRIRHHVPGGEELYYLGWCHGPCGTSRSFAELARQTGDVRYAEAVRRCERSVLESGIPEQRLPGFWDNVGLCCGSAGVIEFLLERARATGDARFLDFAQRVGDDLLARGTRDERGLRFVQAEHRVRPDQREAQTGLMQGAAGIGLALLHLGLELARAPLPSIRLPDAR